MVLDRLDFDVPPGQFISLIGPSGCGKSTCLRVISALSPVSSGAVRIDGNPPTRGGREATFIFQEATLLPWLSVLGNIEMPLRICGLDREERRQRAREMLRAVRLADVAHRYPRQLSGGMKMRVSVARALVQSPRLLLLDEPFGALDEMTRQHLNEELLQMHASLGWTAFFVTHSVAEAVFLSDRVLVMAANPGRIHADLTIDLPRPRSAETRESASFQSWVTTVSRALRSVEGGS